MGLPCRFQPVCYPVPVSYLALSFLVWGTSYFLPTPSLLPFLVLPGSLLVAPIPAGFDFSAVTHSQSTFTLRCRPTGSALCVLDTPTPRVAAGFSSLSVPASSECRK